MGWFRALDAGTESQSFLVENELCRLWETRNLLERALGVLCQKHQRHCTLSVPFKNVHSHGCLELKR